MLSGKLDVIGLERKLDSEQMLSGILEVNDENSWRGTCHGKDNNVMLSGGVVWGGRCMQGSWMALNITCYCTKRVMLSWMLSRE